MVDWRTWLRLLCSVLLLRKTVFSFNAAEGVVHWRRRRLLSVSTGDIPFSEIKGIGTETTSGNNNVTTYRLTILTEKGSVPLSDAYGGNRDKYASIRADLMRFLHLEAGEGSGADQDGSNAVGAGDLDSDDRVGRDYQRRDRQEYESGEMRNRSPGGPVVVRVFHKTT